MAGERTLPGVGLTAFWTSGSNGYKAQMDENMRKLSVLTQGHFKSSLALEPASPVNGDVYRATADWSGVAVAGQIVVRDNGAWVAYTPSSGWMFYDRFEGVLLQYAGGAWAEFTSGDGGGGGGGDGGGGGEGKVALPRFYGLRKYMPPFTPPAVTTWAKAALDAPVADPYGFDGADEFVIPVGVTKVRVTAFVRSTGNEVLNQWTLYKNGLTLTTAEGRFIGETTEGGYGNGGASLVSAVLDVVTGDTLSLRYYVSSNLADWSGWFEIEAVEHTLGTSSVGAVAYIAPESYYLSSTYTTFSTSAYATKGSMFSVNNERHLSKASVVVDGVAGQTVVTRIVRLDSVDPGTILDVLYTVDEQLVEADTTVEIRPPGGLQLFPGTIYAVLVTRTDGTGTEVLGVYFPGTAADADPSGHVNLVACARFDSLAPAVGDGIFYNNTSHVVFRFYTTDMNLIDYSANEIKLTSQAADFDVTDNLLRGDRYVEADTAGALTITVPPGLVQREPLTVERAGAGTVTFAPGAGVTINSADAKLDLRAQFSAGTLVPKGNDVYTLIGDLA